MTVGGRDKGIDGKGSTVGRVSIKHGWVKAVSGRSEGRYEQRIDW